MRQFFFDGLLPEHPSTLAVKAYNIECVYRFRRLAHSAASLPLFVAWIRWIVRPALSLWGRCGFFFFGCFGGYRRQEKNPIAPDNRR
jgi:hypothetical protein